MRIKRIYTDCHIPPDPPPYLLIFLSLLSIGQSIVSLVRKTIHILLAFLVISSSSGLVVNQHYCFDDLVSVAYFLPANSCIPAQKKEPSGSHSQQVPQKKIDRKSCCSNQTDLLKVAQEQQGQFFELQVHVEKVVHPFLLGTLSMGFPIPATDNIYYVNYRPPLLAKDISVHLQVFRC